MGPLAPQHNSQQLWAVFLAQYGRAARMLLVQLCQQVVPAGLVPPSVPLSSHKLLRRRCLCCQHVLW